VWKKGEVHTGFEWGNMREKGHWKDLGVDDRIILKSIFKRWDWEMDLIVLAENRDRWQALVVNAVISIRIP
jgi:hypothetical protein